MSNPPAPKLELFDSPSFNIRHYVDTTLKQLNARDDIRVTQQSLDEAAEKTAQQLKKSVYQNYTEFINTYKEISTLENELYEVNHLLTEQKQLLTSLKEFSFLYNKPADPSKDTVFVEEPEIEKETRRKSLTILQDQIEGISSVLNVHGRELIQHSELVELHHENLVEMDHVYLVLFSDCLVVCSRSNRKRGGLPFVLSTTYNAGTFVHANVHGKSRKSGDLPHCFKLIIFPGTHRIFQAANDRLHREWTKSFDEMLKKRSQHDIKKRESSLSLGRPITSPRKKSINPFDEDEEEELRERMEVRRSLSIDIISEEELPEEEEWMSLVPEELDMLLAQRNFQKAVDLLKAVDNQLNGMPDTPAVRDFIMRIEQRVNQLVERLENDIVLSSERHGQSSLRTPRTAVALLIALGKCSKASSLFLNMRTQLLQRTLKEIKLEGATPIYVQNLAHAFFYQLVVSGSEFNSSFIDHLDSCASFATWAQAECENFVGMLFKQQLLSVQQIGFSTMAQCIKILLEKAYMPQGIGLDLSFVVTDTLRVPVERAIGEHKTNLMDTLKLTTKEEEWIPATYQSRTSLQHIEDQFVELGLKSFRKHIYDKSRVSLSVNTIQFTRSYLLFVKDVCTLYFPEVNQAIIEAIVEMLKLQLKHCEKSLKTDKFRGKEPFILKNVDFLLESVLPITEKKYKQASGLTSKYLKKLYEKKAQLGDVLKERKVAIV